MYGGCRQIYAGLVCGMAALLSGTALGWASGFLHKMKKHKTPFQMTAEQKSWIVALMDFGNFVSPIFTGYVMDCIGRKCSFILTGIICLVSWILVTVAKESICMCVGRFLAGVGKGAAFTIIPMYLAEIAETKVRGALSTIFCIQLYLGICLAYFYCPYVSYNVMNYISTAIPVLYLFLLLFIPESPYYWYMKNNKDGALKAFTYLRSLKADDSAEKKKTVADEMTRMEAAVEKEMKSRGRFIDLLSTPGMRKASLIVMFLSIFQRLDGISCHLAYTSIILPETGGGASIGLGPAEYMVGFGIVLFIANFISVAFVDVLGRKPLLIASNVILFLVCATSGMFYHLENINKTRPLSFDITKWNWVPYINVLNYAFGYSFGIGVIPSTLLGELFPANVRSKAAAIATMHFSLGSFLTNKVFLYVSKRWGLHMMYYFFSLMNLISIIFTAIFCFETKGKTLMEIQEMLND